MLDYKKTVEHFEQLIARGGDLYKNISAENAARMDLQNRFKTGLDIAKYTADIMHKDMSEYDGDSSVYTQSLGCWHGFTAQQMMMEIKKSRETTNKRYVYLSGWMVAALRSDFGPLPDQSMHEKLAVPNLIKEIYTFLKRADAVELQHLFNELDEVRDNGGDESVVISKIDNFETHVVPIIADIDAGFGNEEATYLLAKKMIQAGACCIQIENQVSDEKQCGHQDGKVTVPHEDFLHKINAVRYSFLELGVENGLIVARTDSLGAGLTQKVPVMHEEGDLADQYNSFLETEEITNLEELVDRVVLDCITSLQNGADLLWIETEKPNVQQISDMVNEIRKVEPKAKLVYNNSPSFNWTLSFREQVYKEWVDSGKDVSAYPDPSSDPKGLMDVKFDDSELALEADNLIQTFQKDASREAGIFHHLITLPTYHETALGTATLTEGYFGDEGMLAYVKGIQRQEIRRDMSSVKHQDLAGSTIGDTHKEYFSGDKALKAGGKDNTMNQF